jgi:hypothetical protein
MLTIIESPFNPDEKTILTFQGVYTPAELMAQNITYAQLALGDSFDRGESPFLSHLLYTQAKAETPELRSRGIRAGLQWLAVADQSVAYVDLGISEGMQFGAETAHLRGVTTHARFLFRDLCSDYCAVRALLHQMSIDKRGEFPALLALAR